MTGCELYDFSYSYLVNQSRPVISKQEIDDFLNNSDLKKQKTSFKDIYELLAIVLQDFYSYPNIINFKERKNEIKRVLHNYCLEYIANLSSEKLLKAFRSKFHFVNTVIWEKYCKSLISGASFLLSFNDIEDFKKTCDFMDLNHITREAFALYVSTKIYNMGFAIACNFLKELGYQNYPKPDIHMIDICYSLGLVSNRNPIETYEAMIKIAEEANVSAYKLDKLWWLICSGDFYRYNKKITPQKKDFIKAVKDKFNIQ